ncbi:hypothetical protein [Egicoccus sp. AB-alg6-2]|uniref:hypothetical protein n=1 Tax=Egicoccus sp. AB-alg6-2 TaxID=3242692 RepID=UPI00359CCF5C
MLRVLTALLAAALLLPTMPARGAEAETVDPPAADRGDGIAWLERALAASRDVPHTGRLLVVSFSREGPQLTEVEVTRGVDGGLTVVKEGGWEVGRVGEEAFLRSSGTLLRLGGIERGSSVDLDRLADKYAVTSDAEPARLDTGPARVLRLREHGGEHDREVLYLDVDTDLIVRRETFGMDGEPMRVVAYTALEVVDARVVAPDPEGLEVEAFSLTAGDLAGFQARGFVAPDALPAGYRLLGGFERPEASVPTMHLVYGDGLYTLSVFEQQGRLSPAALEGASLLPSPTGGAVWRLPGSEPRRVIWRGDGRTFTAITDAPVDELLTVVAGLPNDPAPSMLGRLTRGIGRVGRWLWPLDRSDT